MQRSLLIPTSFKALVAPDRAVFDAFEVDDGFVMETVFYGWYWKESNFLYDVLAEQFVEEHLCQVPESFDSYHTAIKNVMDRVEPYLLDMDKVTGNRVEYIDIADIGSRQHDPYFIVNLHYER